MQTTIVVMANMGRLMWIPGHPEEGIQHMVDKELFEKDGSPLRPQTKRGKPQSTTLDKAPQQAPSETASRLTRLRNWRLPTPHPLSYDNTTDYITLLEYSELRVGYSRCKASPRNPRLLG